MRTNWEIIRLGNAATFVNGFPFKPSDWSSEGLEIIRIQNLTKGSSEVNYFQGSIHDKYKVRFGDLLISWSATLGIYEWQGEDSWVNQHIFKVIFDKKEFNKSFFKHLISASLKKLGEEVHGATMKHITKSRFDEFKIPYPSLEVQQKIAEILDAADLLRKKTQQIINSYDELAQSIFLDMFGYPVTNSKGWPIVKFESLGSIERGKSKHRPRNAPELLGGVHPLIQTGDIANAARYISDFKSTYSDIGLAQSKKWRSGTLCITIAANIAKTAILTFDACFPDSVVGYVPNKKTNVIYMQFWISFLQKILEDSAPESAQKNINLRILKELDVPLPKIEYQTQFAERITLIEQQKDLAKQSLKESEDLFNTLLQKAFKGELNI